MKMHARAALTLFTLLVVYRLDFLVQAAHHERRLYQDMLREYNILERPVANHSQPIVVRLRVALQQLIDVDEKNQIVNVNAWLDYVGVHVE